MRASFDFDGTLDRKDVQQYAGELRDRGIELVITTARIMNPPSKSWNDDLYLVAGMLAIPEINIVFCEFCDKMMSFNDDIVFHLDDDEFEIKLINVEHEGKTKGVSVNSMFWKQECEKIIADAELKLKNTPVRSIQAR